MIVKLSELERTMKLFEQKEDGMVGICSLEENASDSPLDMLNAMKPYGTPEEQEFIDLIVNFLQAPGFTSPTEHLRRTVPQARQKPKKAAYAGMRKTGAAPPAVPSEADRIFPLSI